MSLAESTSEISHLDDEERDCLEKCFEATGICEWCADVLREYVDTCRAMTAGS